MTPNQHPIVKQAAARGLGLVCLALILASCGGPKKPAGLGAGDDPVGGTPAELNFQYAKTIAKNGNCDQALPVFICLGAQGLGWELAQHSGGMCALEAARLWQGPLQKRDGFYGKTSKVSYDKPYYQSKEALYAKGLALLRSTAGAGWPDSQAALAQELGAIGQTQEQMMEAKFWLTQYDRNARRKIYGSNVLGPEIRARLADSPLPSPDDPKWGRQTLLKSPNQGAFCQTITRRRPPAPRREKKPENPALPAPETIGGPSRQR